MDRSLRGAFDCAAVASRKVSSITFSPMLYRRAIADAAALLLHWDYEYRAEPIVACCPMRGQANFAAGVVLWGTTALRHQPSAEAQCVRARGISFWNISSR